MTIVKIPGQGMQIPHPQPFAMPPVFLGTAVLTTSGSKVAFIGRVWNKDGATKNISKVSFLFGAVTKAGSTDVQVSLQDVLTTSLSVDESVDQSGLVGNVNIIANTWTEVTLGATRSVAHGAVIGVVFEFGTFNASDSVVIQTVSALAINGVPNQCYAQLKSGTWSTLTAIPNIVFDFDDGTCGTLLGATPWSAINTHTYNSGSAADELALEWQLPFAGAIDSVGGFIDMDGDGDLVLYDGTSAMSGGTVSHDKDQRQRGNAVAFHSPLSAHVVFAANTTYRLALKPTSVTSLTLYSADVNAAEHWAAAEGGAAFKYTDRVDAGAWAAPTATRRPLLWFSVIGVDTGSAPAAATLVNGGLAR